MAVSSTSPQTASVDHLADSFKHNNNRILNNYNSESNIGGIAGVPIDTSPKVSWDYFDEAGYIARGGLRKGEDPYSRNKFNQKASDELPSNREIPDTRNPM